ncbi:MAG: hypothetical protein AAB861_04090, partial [Patescibacteria group bacterium]
MPRILENLREEKIIKAKDNWEDIDFYRPPKTLKDKEDGYRGRLGIYEVLNVSSAVKNIIIKGGTAEDILLQAKKEGLLTMLEDGVFKAAQGLTSIEEILRVVSE